MMESDQKRFGVIVVLLVIVLIAILIGSGIFKPKFSPIVSGSGYTSCGEVSATDITSLVVMVKNINSTVNNLSNIVKNISVTVGQINNTVIRINASVTNTTVVVNTTIRNNVTMVSCNNQAYKNCTGTSGNLSCGSYGSCIRLTVNTSNNMYYNCAQYSNCIGISY